MSFVCTRASQGALSSARATRAAVPVLPRLPVQAPRTRSVIACASTEDDPSAKLNEQLRSAGDWLKARWQQTDDAEKPAAVAIIIGSIVAQIAIGATVDAVDRLPFVQQFLEFVGLAVVGVYGWRYITDPSERDNVKRSIDSFVQAVTGK